MNNSNKILSHIQKCLLEKANMHFEDHVNLPIRRNIYMLCEPQYLGSSDNICKAAEFQLSFLRINKELCWRIFASANIREFFSNFRKGRRRSITITFKPCNAISTRVAPIMVTCRIIHNLSTIWKPSSWMRRSWWPGGRLRSWRERDWSVVTIANFSTIFLHLLQSFIPCHSLIILQPINAVSTRCRLSLENAVITQHRLAAWRQCRCVVP